MTRAHPILEAIESAALWLARNPAPESYSHPYFPTDAWQFLGPAGQLITCGSPAFWKKVEAAERLWAENPSALREACGGVLGFRVVDLTTDAEQRQRVVALLIRSMSRSVEETA